MRPSSEDILIPQLLEEGSSVYVFGEQRIFCPRYIAAVDRTTDEFLELRLDPDDLSASMIQTGQHVLIGFAVARRQMQFGAKARVLSTQPGGRLVTSAPRRVEKWPQRDYVRAPLSVPCELTLWQPGRRVPHELEGVTGDISASGARVELTSESDDLDLVSAEGKVILHFSDRPPIVTACTVVRKCPPRGDSNERAAFGIRYQGLPEADEMLIQLLVLRATARRFLRVEAAIPCRVEVQSEDGRLWNYSGVSENISAGGMLMHVGEYVPVAAGDRIVLTVSLPTRYLALADARVVRAEHFDDLTRVAVDFGKLGELDYQSLMRFVIGRLRGVPDAANLDATPATDHFPILQED